jgi:hypothetical protein
MDILEKIKRLMIDTTAHAEDSVDISQGPYRGNVLGMTYRKKKVKVKGGAAYNMHEGTYKVTVIVKSKKYRKTFDIDAPTEGKARTRAINQAMKDGLRLAGDDVEYLVVNEKRAMSISGQKGAGKMKMDMDTKRKELVKRGLIGDKKKRTFVEWMKLYFPDEKEEAAKEKKAKKKLQTAKINLAAFKKMRG